MYILYIYIHVYALIYKFIYAPVLLYARVCLCKWISIYEVYTAYIHTYSAYSTNTHVSFVGFCASGSLIGRLIHSQRKDVNGSFHLVLHILVTFFLYTNMSRSKNISLF